MQCSEWYHLVAYTWKYPHGQEKQNVCLDIVGHKPTLVTSAEPHDRENPAGFHAMEQSNGFSKKKVVTTNKMDSKY